MDDVPSKGRGNLTCLQGTSAPPPSHTHGGLTGFFAPATTMAKTVIATLIPSSPNPPDPFPRTGEAGNGRSAIHVSAASPAQPGAAYAVLEKKPFDAAYASLRDLLLQKATSLRRETGFERMGLSSNTADAGTHTGARAREGPASKPASIVAHFLRPLSRTRT
ncbi:hypothetical protein LY78DRAFT_660374 [Colletotrichum sublineola]|uniref:Uncharacterized protein n=1 Tax=Colletotrichum sublineola TaxID=1173701 RepID=A0A066XBC8_COLSU|nr:hypothetical protein LY78DRAFT_660374 [Colletotrichum sublineola]KDN66207.1 hypothetical protein CSUB01_06120 [Colletotrichum sublineola]